LLYAQQKPESVRITSLQQAPGTQKSNIHKTSIFSNVPQQHKTFLNSYIQHQYGVSQQTSKNISNIKNFFTPHASLHVNL
jgi:hypothetical protein